MSPNAEPVPAAVRQAVYGLLARAFSAPPTEADLSRLADADWQQVLTALTPDSAPDSLRQWADAAPPNAAEQAAARQEFHQLFMVPGRHYLAPYESVFRGTREVEGQPVPGLLCGPPAMEVRQWYRLAALEIAPDHADLPDHIAVELAYLAHLCGKEAEFASQARAPQLDRAREMQRDFLAGHLIVWAGLLAAKLRQRSVHPYFRALADLLADFPRRDLTRLEQDLGPSRATGLPEYPSTPE